MSEWRLWVFALAMVYAYLLFLFCAQSLYRVLKPLIRNWLERKRGVPS